MEESERVTIFLKAASHLMGEVFIRVADLQDVFDVFAADIRCHSVCLELYLRRYEISLNGFSPPPRVSKKRATFQMEIERAKFILDWGNRLTLSEIRDITDNKQAEVEISNKEIKLFLMEQLQDSIQFWPSKNKNESLLIFSSKLSAQDMVQKVRSTDIIISAALSLCHAMLEESFDLDDKFCNADDLEKSWKKTKMSDKFMTFFSSLFNIKKYLMLADPVFNETHLQSPDFVEDDIDTDNIKLRI